MAPAPSGPRRRGDLTATRGAHRATNGYRRAHHGTWEPASTIPTPTTRLAAATLTCPDAVATGWLAAAIHGHPWLPRQYPVELAVGARRVRRKGIVARRYAIPDEHVETVLSADGRELRVASPEWTLFDLARYQNRVEAMVALDGAYRMGPGYNPRYSLPRLVARYPGLRRSRLALERCEDAEPKTESAMETRLRMLLLDLGLAGFEVQYNIPGLPYRADFAYPERKILVEYDGGGHRTAAQHARDAHRANRLRGAGWTLIVVTATLFYRQPRELAAQLLAVLG